MVILSLDLTLIGELIPVWRCTAIYLDEDGRRSAWSEVGESPQDAVLFVYLHLGLPDPFEE